MNHASFSLSLSASQGIRLNHATACSSRNMSRICATGTYAGATETSLGFQSERLRCSKSCRVVTADASHTLKQSWKEHANFALICDILLSKLPD